jgi:hypothetical protein
MRRLRIRAGLLALALGLLVPGWAWGDFRSYLPAIPAVPGAVNRLVLVAPRDGTYVIYPSSGDATLSAKGVSGEALEVSLAKGDSVEITYTYRGPMEVSPVREAVVAQEGGVEVFRGEFDLGMRVEARSLQVPMAIRGMPRLVRVEAYDPLHPSLDLGMVMGIQGDAVRLSGAAEVGERVFPMDHRELGFVLPGDVVSGDVTVSLGFRSSALGGALTPVRFRLNLKETELPPEWQFLYGLNGAFDPAAVGWAMASLPKGAMEAGQELGRRSKPTVQALEALGAMLQKGAAAEALVSGYLKGSGQCLAAVGPGARVKVLRPDGTPYGGPVSSLSGWTYVLFPQRDRVVLRLEGDGSAPVRVIKLLPEGRVERTYPSGTWRREVEVLGSSLKHPKGGR